MSENQARILKKSGRIALRLSLVLFICFALATVLVLFLQPDGTFRQSVHANTPPPTYTLFITISPANAVPSAVLLDDGTDADASVHVSATVVNITATPDIGWVFDHWEGDLTGTTNPTTVTLDDDRYVTAVFVLKDTPTAAFSGTPILGEDPLIVTFTDESHPGTSAITNWDWDFEDDGVVDSTDQHPVFTYVTPGLYTVSLTVTNASGASTETKTGYVDVRDKPTVDFVAGASTVSESFGALDLQAVLNFASASDTTLTVSVTSGTATGGGTDYTLLTTTLTFLAGETSKLVSLTIDEDLLDEDDETLAVTLSAPANAFLGTVTSHTVTITDNDDPPTIQFAVATSSVIENAGTVDAVVTLSATSGKEVTAWYALTDGTATGGGVDYDSTGYLLVFAPGETSKTITVTIEDDVLGEPDEDFTITFLGGIFLANATLGTITSHVVTITNDGDLPGVSFLASSASVVESAGTRNLNVDLTILGTTDVTVDYAVTSGTATGGGVDYTLTAGTLTYDATLGETSKTITIPITNDLLDEDDENLVITLSNPVGALFYADTSITLTITDDDPLPTMQFTAATQTVDEGVGTVDFTVTLSEASGRQVSEFVAVTDGAAQGLGVDYSLLSQLLIFTPGETSKTFTASIVDDLIGEADEDFTLELTGGFYLFNATLGTIASQIVTIADNGDLPSVSFWTSNSTVAEDAITTDLTVNLTVPWTLDVTVDYAVTSGTATGVGTDYTLADGTLTFLPGETSKTITVTISDDALHEDPETLVVTLSNPVQAQLLTNILHTLTITDNDAVPVSDFVLASSSVAEDAGTHTVDVLLSAPAGKPLRVHFSAIDGTATGGNVDYGISVTELVGGIVFEPGETSKPISMTIIDDILGEDDEDVTLVFTGGLFGIYEVPAGTTTSHVVTITDDGDLPGVGFTRASVSVDENVGTVTLTVNLSVPATTASSVDYTVTAGTATEGVDYSLPVGPLSFAIGESSKQIVIPIIDDSLDEPDKTFTLTLSGELGLTLFGTTSQVVTIRDDDDQPTVNFDMGSSAVLENGGSVTLGLTLDIASGKDITLLLPVTDGTAKGGGTDYQVVSPIVQFPAGSTTASTTFTIVNDNFKEPDEDFTVNIGSLFLSGVTLGTVTSHTVTILDDGDLPGVGFSGKSASVNEAIGNVILTANLTAAATAAGTVDYFVSAGTATGAGTDFTLAAGTLSYGVGDTTKSISIPIVDDPLNEGSETIVVTLTNPVGLVLKGNKQFTVTITDDDPLPTVDFVLSSSTTAEGVATHQVEVILSGPSGQQVKVRYDATDGTAEGLGVDYDIPAGPIPFVTFEPGETSKLIDVTIVDDAFGEIDETFTLTLSSFFLTNAVLGTSTSHAVTLQDNGDPPGVSFAIAASSAAESALTQNITVQLTVPVPSPGPATIDYGVTSGTATVGTDYTVGGTGTLTLNAGDTSRVITITLVDDTMDESDETLQLTLSGPVGLILLDDTTHTLTITDNDAPPTVSFALANNSVDEAIGTIDVDVVLTAASGHPISVDYIFHDGNAFGEGMDYSVATGAIGTLDFAVGETSKTVTVSIVDDTIGEPDELFDLSLWVSDETFVVIGTPYTHEITITDNGDLPAISFALPTSVVDEDTTTPLLVGVLLSVAPATGDSVTIDYSVTAGTATDVIDYSIAAGPLTFSAGENSKFVSVTIVNDSLDEFDENVEISLSSPDPFEAQLVDVTSHLIIIVDEDLEPTIEFAQPTLSVTEDVGSLSSSVTLTPASGKEVRVDYTVVDGTAKGFGGDYLANSGTFVFAPGDTSKVIDITIVDDDVGEADESFIIILTSPVEAVLGANAQQTISIADDNDMPGISFSLDSSAVNEDAGSATIQVDLQTPSPDNLEITVNYAVTGGSAVGDGADYTLAPMAVHIPAGSTSVTFDITIVDDVIDEESESVLISLFSPTNGVLDGVIVHTLSILDNDAPPDVNFDIASSSVQEDTPVLNLVLSLAVASERVVTIQLGEQDGLAVGGGVDYSLTDVSVVFAPGELTKTVQVTIVNDTVGEPPEDFTIDLLATSSNATLGSVPSHTVTITDDGDLPGVHFALAGTSVDEGIVSTTVDISLTAPATEALDIQYLVTEQSAVGGGQDFTLASGFVTIGTGISTVSLSVSVTEDAFDEFDESFTIELTDALAQSTGVAGAQLLGTTTHLFTIADNDIEPTATFAYSAINVNEGHGTLNAEVILSALSGKTVVVPFTVSDITTEPGDYSATSGSLSFAPGEISNVIPITIIDDSFAEEDEQLQISLNPFGLQNVTLGVTTEYILTIEDNGDLPGVEFATAISSVSEATLGGLVNLSVVLTAPSPTPISVDYTVTGGSALSPNDYTLTSGTLTFTSSDLIQVTIVDDVIDEANENIVITLSNPVGAVLHTNASHTLTILDDDAVPTVSFLSATASVVEDGLSIDIEAVLSAASEQTAAVNYSVLAGTATALGVDFTASGGSLIFVPGDSSETITVTIVNDNLGEPDETFTVQLNPFGINNLALGAIVDQVVTIVDDGDLPGVSFVTDTQTVGEGSVSTTVDVQLSVAQATDVTVQYTAVDNTAIGGGQDYTLAPNTLTIPAGLTIATITVFIDENALNEAQENFSIVLSAPVGGVLTGTTTHTVKINDNDAEPTVSFDSATSLTTEGDTGVVLNVSLSSISEQSVTVNYSASAGSATATSDFVVSSGTLTFAPGEIAKTIPVTIVDDAIGELDEDFTVSLTFFVNATLGATGTATVTIQDNGDQPGVEFSTASAPVGESDGTATVDVVLTAPNLLADVTVDYAVTGGTASGTGVDYTLASGMLTFVGTSTSETISFPILDDALDEDDETIAITLSMPTNATLHTNTVHTLSIIDGDAMPTVEFVSTATTVQENVGTIMLTVNLSTASGRPVTINFKGVNVTAVIAVPGYVQGDYDLPSTSLTINPGETSTSLPVTIVDDVEGEIDETFKIKIASAPNATFGTNLEHIVTILSDSDLPMVSLRLSPLYVSESIFAVHPTARLSVPATEEIVVSYWGQSYPTRTGRFSIPDPHLVFPPGATTAIGTVLIYDDLVEQTAQEHVDVWLGSVLSGNAVITDNSRGIGGTLRIVDNETTPTPAFALPSSQWDESSGTVGIDITLSTPSAKMFWARWRLDETIMTSYEYSFESTNGVYFRNRTNGYIAFEPGETTKQLLVDLVDDGFQEPMESARFSLIGGGGTPYLGTDVQHVLNVMDNDQIFAARLSTTETIVNEEVGIVSIDVVLDTPANRDIPIQYSVSRYWPLHGKSYLPTFQDPEAILLSPNPLVITAGQSSATIQLQLLNDYQKEVPDIYRIDLRSSYVPWGSGNDPDYVVRLPYRARIIVEDAEGDVGNVSVSSTIGGSAFGGGAYTGSSQVLVYATPNPGWRFSHWFDLNTALSKNDNAPMSMLGSVNGVLVDHSVQAVFEEIANPEDYNARLWSVAFISIPANPNGIGPTSTWRGLLTGGGYSSILGLVKNGIKHSSGSTREYVPYDLVFNGWIGDTTSGTFSPDQTVSLENEDQVLIALFDAVEKNEFTVSVEPPGMASILVFEPGDVYKALVNDVRIFYGITPGDKFTLKITNVPEDRVVQWVVDGAIVGNEGEIPVIVSPGTIVVARLEAAKEFTLSELEGGTAEFSYVDAAGVTVTGGGGTYSLPLNLSVDLSVIPEPGWFFVGWLHEYDNPLTGAKQGSIVSRTANHTIRLEEDASLKALFAGGPGGGETPEWKKPNYWAVFGYGGDDFGHVINDPGVPVDTSSDNSVKIVKEELFFIAANFEMGDWKDGILNEAHGEWSVILSPDGKKRRVGIDQHKPNPLDINLIEYFVAGGNQNETAEMVFGQRMRRIDTNEVYATHILEYQFMYNDCPNPQNPDCQVCEEYYHRQTGNVIVDKSNVHNTDNPTFWTNFPDALRCWEF